MKSSEQFAQLARLDSELTELAARGRRRAVVMMTVAFLPSPFLVMATNDDSSLVSVIPVLLACFSGISYSWSKWRRRPEDSQSIAFIGLSRAQRKATYRAMWRGSPLEDRAVLSIVEAMHAHVRRGLWLVLATAVAAGGFAAALAALSGQGATLWIVVAMATALAIGVAGVRWVADRAGLVIAAS